MSAYLYPELIEPKENTVASHPSRPLKLFFVQNSL